MSFFREMRDALSSSPVPAFKREWLQTCDYIQFKCANDSRSIANAKINSQLTILADYCARRIPNPHTATITIWWHREFEVTVAAAFYIAARYAELREEGIDITDSATRMILDEVHSCEMSANYSRLLQRYI